MGLSELQSSHCFITISYIIFSFWKVNSFIFVIEEFIWIGLDKVLWKRRILLIRKRFFRCLDVLLKLYLLFSWKIDTVLWKRHISLIRKTFFRCLDVLLKLYLLFSWKANNVLWKRRKSLLRKLLTSQMLIIIKFNINMVVINTLIKCWLFLSNFVRIAILWFQSESASEKFFWKKCACLFYYEIKNMYLNSWPIRELFYVFISYKS